MDFFGMPLRSVSRQCHLEQVLLTLNISYIWSIPPGLSNICFYRYGILRFISDWCFVTFSFEGPLVHAMSCGCICLLVLGDTVNCTIRAKTSCRWEDFWISSAISCLLVLLLNAVPIKISFPYFFEPNNSWTFAAFCPQASTRINNPQTWAINLYKI